jgi:RraA family protein
MDTIREAGQDMQAETPSAPYHQKPEIVRRLGAIPAANIGDAQERIGVASGLSPIWTGAKLAGPAYTVWTRPGDNLFIHKAIDGAKPGDVIVVNGGGDVSRALIGDLIGIRAKSMGIAGFVIDGAVRDADALAACGLPVFARSVTPAGPYKHGPGRLQIPVAIAGVVVSPGDIVVADADGVVVVRRDEAEQVLAEAERIEANEAAKRVSYEAAMANS